MFDFRESKIITLSDAERISEDSGAFLYVDPATKKKYVVKTFEIETKDSEIYLFTEFKKMMLLSAEPEVCSVYGLVTVIKKETNARYLGYLMDYVNGRSISEVLNDGEISFGFFTDMMLQLSSGLEKAAYYEVMHHDIHPGNVMIDVFGQLKIVDFLWNDYNQNLNKDLEDFKKLAAKLFDAVEAKDKEKTQIISDYLQQIKSFRNVSRVVYKLKDIATTLSLLDYQGRFVLAALLSQMDNSFKLGMKYLKSDIGIHPQFIPELTEQELQYIELEKSNKLKLVYFDSRYEKVQNGISDYLNKLFSQLQNAQLCSCKVGVYNQGPKFIGPYIARIEIDIFIELVRWKEIQDEFLFLPLVTEDEFIDDVFSSQWVNELYMYNSLTKWPDMKL